MVEEITRGLVCETKLMGRLETEHAESHGLEGTLFWVTVASQSEVFVSTRDPSQLEKMRGRVENDLINQAVSAVANISARDSPVQRMLRMKLKGAQQLANLNKAHGVKDLVLVGFCEDGDERAAQASMALSRLRKEPDSRFSPLVDEPDRTNVEGEERREVVREFTQEAFAALGMSMDSPVRPPPPPPPLPPSWPPPLSSSAGRSSEERDLGSGRSAAEPAAAGVADAGGEPTKYEKRKVGYRWSSFWQSREAGLGCSEQPGCQEWEPSLGMPP
jgi:hypothetical protein